MTSNLTRFYLEEEFEYVAKTPVIDVETTEADEVEQKLKDQDIIYTRVDL
jgi:hypothetical protein